MVSEVILRFNECIARWDKTNYSKDTSGALKACSDLQVILEEYVSDIKILEKFNKLKVDVYKTKDFKEIRQWFMVLYNFATYVDLIVYPAHLKKDMRRMWEE